jgi:hypothetical protein
MLSASLQEVAHSKHQNHLHQQTLQHHQQTPRHHQQTLRHKQVLYTTFTILVNTTKRLYTNNDC